MKHREPHGGHSGHEHHSTADAGRGKVEEEIAPAADEEHTDRVEERRTGTGEHSHTEPAVKHDHQR